MKIFMLQTMWSCDQLHKRRYFKTRKAAVRAMANHSTSEWYLGSRIVEIELED